MPPAPKSLPALCLPLALLGCSTATGVSTTSPPPAPIQQASEPVTASGPILAIGDSIFKWNAETNSDIPTVLGQALGRPVTNSAVSGAHLSLPKDNGSSLDYDIRQQYQSQAWDWVVMNGGANDLAGSCDCQNCDSLLDEMISADGLTGEIPEFARQVTANGSQLMYVGYYAMPADARFGFDQCNDELDTHNARLAQMAAALPDVWFVSATAVVSPENPAAYDTDRVHPSAAGSEQIGRYIAQAIAAVEAE